MVYKDQYYIYPIGTSVLPNASVGKRTRCLKTLVELNKIPIQETNIAKALEYDNYDERCIEIW